MAGDGGVKDRPYTADVQTWPEWPVDQLPLSSEGDRGEGGREECNAGSRRNLVSMRVLWSWPRVLPLIVNS